MAKVFGHNHSGVVGRLGDYALDGIFNGDRLTWLQVKFARRLFGSVLGDLE